MTWSNSRSDLCGTCTRKENLQLGAASRQHGWTIIEKFLDDELLPDEDERKLLGSSDCESSPCFKTWRN